MIHEIKRHFSELGIKYMQEDCRHQIMEGFMIHPVDGMMQVMSAYEAWIKVGLNEELFKGCTVTYQYLPSGAEHSDVVHELLKADKLLDNQDSAGGIIFMNQAWIPWSNTRLARAVVQMQTQLPLTPDDSLLKLQ